MNSINPKYNKSNTETDQANTQNKANIASSAGLNLRASAGIPSQNALNEIRDSLEVLYAVECLEYHNKNWFHLDEEERNREKRRMILRAMSFFDGSHKATYKL